MIKHANRSVRISIKPVILKWARKRASYDLATIRKRFPKYDLWEKGQVSPTLKQLEQLARMLHLPLGYFFLESPPKESLPIPDYRSGWKTRRLRPSPNLLDTIYICQQRQEWYRTYMRSMGEPSLQFVGSANLDDDPVEIAHEIRKTIGFNDEDRFSIPTWTLAFSRFIDRVESAGILVMVNGIVGNNTHRPLEPEEFRGFTLVDDRAPLIFINGKDTISGKTFTLAHELAHIWLGKSGISNVQLDKLSPEGIERWCDHVAAEILVPMKKLKENYNPVQDFQAELERLARLFKVSTLVILRRLFDGGHLTWNKYRQLFRNEFKRLIRYEKRSTKKGGGDFYASLSRRTSKRFAQAVIISTFEGQTLIRDAFMMLGISKMETIKKLAKEVTFG